MKNEEGLNVYVAPCEFGKFLCTLVVDGKYICGHYGWFASEAVSSTIEDARKLGHELWEGDVFSCYGHAYAIEKMSAEPVSTSYYDGIEL